MLLEPAGKAANETCCTVEEGSSHGVDGALTLREPAGKAANETCCMVEEGNSHGAEA
jgi:hypothetical protein